MTAERLAQDERDCPLQGSHDRPNRGTLRRLDGLHLGLDRGGRGDRAGVTVRSADFRSAGPPSQCPRLPSSRLTGAACVLSPLAGRDPAARFADWRTPRRWLAFAAVGAPLSYLAAAVNLPLQDQLFAAADRALDLDWRAMHRLDELPRPVVYAVLRLIYLSAHRADDHRRAVPRLHRKAAAAANLHAQFYPRRPHHHRDFGAAASRRGLALITA